jgi:hypothetical protein
MLNPLCDTPEAITKALTEHGGTNQYGDPYWRVVLAHNHTRPKDGYWCDWGDGTVEQFTLEGARMRYNAVHPKSIVKEIRDSPIWPNKQGWILERWFPAEVWSSREHWPAGTPYPERGEYYLIAPTFDGEGERINWHEIPDLGDLLHAISDWERAYLSRPRDFEAAVAVLIAQDEEEEEKRRQKLEEDIDYFYRHEVVPIANSLSLGAQRIRNEAAKAMGEKGHIGAGQ